MAKLNSIITFVGKMDNVVGMKGDNGETYARKLVKPLNPRTEDQIDQRLSVSLAGQISKLTPAGAIVGMKGANKRQRRANFMKNIIKSATVTPENDGNGSRQAWIDEEQLILSEGLAARVPTMTAALSGSTVTVTASQWPTDGILAGVLLVVYGIENGIYVSCAAGTLGIGDSSVQVNLPRVDTTANFAARCYAIPLLPAPGRAASDYEEGVLSVTDNDFAVHYEGSASSTFDYGRSVPVAFTQA